MIAPWRPFMVLDIKKPPHDAIVRRSLDYRR
jgi:hypothetical protein